MWDCGDHKCKHASSVTQSCLTLHNPMDCSPPSCSVHGIFQARILEQVAVSSSRGSSWPRDWTYVCFISCTSRKFFFFFNLWATPFNCESLLPSSSGDCFPGTLDNLSQRIFLRVVCMFHLSQYKMPSIHQNKKKKQKQKTHKKWVHEFTIIWP